MQTKLALKEGSYVDKTVALEGHVDKTVALKEGSYADKTVALEEGSHVDKTGFRGRVICKQNSGFK